MNLLKRLSYHHIFLLIGLVFGLKMVFVNPPWQANDEDRHFYNAYNLSEGHLGPQAQNDSCGFVLPVNLVATVIQFQSIKFNEKTKLNLSVIENIKENELNKEKTMFWITPSGKLQPFPYIPAALMIKMGSFFKSSPVWLGWWARIGSLLAYLLIVTLAIKKLPHFKPLLMLIALSPMALYQGTSVSYDTLSFAFLFLFFALIIAYYYQTEKISFKQIMLLFLVALAQRFSKDGYFLMFFSFAFIPINKFENKKLFFGTFALMLVASFLPSQLWSMYLNSMKLPPEMPLQNDYLFSSSKSIEYHLQQPVEAIRLIVLNILSQGKDWIHGSLGRFGYSYTFLPITIVSIYLLVIIFSVLTEETEQKLSMRFRLPVLGLALLNCLAIIVSLFLIITPVGGHYLHGLQGRYFTPLLPFLFVLLFYLPKPIIQASWMRWAVPIFISIVLWYTLQFINETFYYPV
ncbi:MAG: DUF2142 domain-containing protein [Bacteroidetes bacterium]|nr:DUF2142 domain-containing protein [Bacteroidota bacterium]